MTTCPLAADWLDLLEGRASSADRRHLDECPSCRATVKAISESAGLSGEPLTARVLASVASAQTEKLPEPPALASLDVGQLWWTAEVSEVGSRLAVLITDIEDADSGVWLDAVPLWLDDTLGTNADLRFDANDTSTGMGWRAAFRHQFVLSRSLLEAPIGVLTESGATLLEEALSGHLDVARTGAPIESEYDSRLLADDWIAVAVHALAADYASEHGSASVASVTQISDTKSQHAGEAAGAGVLLVLMLSKEPAPKENVPYRLAAATTPSAFQWVRAKGDDPGSGAHVDGWLRLSDDDQLLFEVKEARGVPERVLMTLYTRRPPGPISAEAELKPGEAVVLGRDLGISEFDVERVEIGPR